MKSRKELRKKQLVCLIGLVLFLSSFYLGSFLMSNVSASVQNPENSVEWGDNVFQNLPYDYTGTFYESTDPEFAFSTAKINFTYIPDPTVSYEHTITEDFTNTEQQQPYDETNFTVSDGSYKDLDNLTSNDNNYGVFNYTGVGHYVGTYSFEDELDGSNPSGWGTFETGGSIQVVNEENGHKKVLEFFDTSTSSHVYAFQTFTGYYEIGTVEFWHCANDSNKNVRMYVRDSTFQTGVLMGMDNGNYKYNTGTQFINVLSFSANVWYHHKVIFDCSAKTFDWSIDGVLVLDDGLFYDTDVETMHDIIFHTWGSNPDANYVNYFDAIGYSWDNDYCVGWNREENARYGDYPALYSFENDTIGSFPSGWTDADSSNCESKVIGSEEGHKKVVSLFDGDTSPIANIYNDFSPQTTGTIEFWVSHNLAVGFTGQRTVSFYLQDMGVASCQISITSSYMTFYNGSWNTFWTHSVIQNRWYYFRVDFDLTTHFIDIYVDGILRADNFIIPVAMGEFDRLTITTHNNGANYTWYIDAIDYSWEDGYSLGRNRYCDENSLLGNYPASYSFIGDEIGDDPYGWNVDEAGGNIQVIGGVGDHRKVVESTYSSSTVSIGDSFTETSSGRIEFWFRTEDTDRTAFYIYDGSLGQDLFMISQSNYFSWYDDGAIKHDIVANSLDVWYHISIYFNTESSYWNVKIDGTQYGNYGFRGSPSAMDHIIFYISGAKTDYYDAIDYSWEPYYVEGRSMNATIGSTMLGNYPATYSFEKQPIWKSGTIEFIDYMMGSDSNPKTEVVNYEDHKHVLKFSSNGDSGTYYSYGSYFASGLTDELVMEFYLAYDDNGGGRSAYYFYNEKSITVFRLAMNHVSNQLVYYWSDTYDVYDLAEKTWAHIKLIINPNTNTQSLWINQELVISNQALYNSETIGNIGVFFVYHDNAGGSNEIVSYIDAIGSSLDSNYLLGDNLNNNYYLGYENFEHFNTTTEGDYYGSESFDYHTEEGVYYGTYDFRDEVGETGTDIEFIDSQSTCFSSILTSSNNHDSILQFNNTVGDIGWIRNYFSSSITVGTIEYWFNIPNMDSDTRGYNYYYDYNGDLAIAIYFIGYSVYYRELDADYVLIRGSLTANQWYHFRMDFDCTSDTCDYYIDGILLIDDGEFRVQRDNVHKNYYGIYESTSTLVVNSHLDAVGYSWDTTSHSGLGYGIGDNINPYDIEPLMQSSFFDEMYFIYNTSIRVLNDLDGHKNVLEMLNNDSTGLRPLFYDTFSGQATGTVEFWLRSSDLSYYYVNLGTNKFQLYITNNKLYYHNGTANIIQDPFLPYYWYHLKLIFDCNGGVDSFCDVYLNGTLIKDNAEFKADTSTIDRFYVYQGDINLENYVWFDAVGYSWDSSYDVGDNINSHGKEVITALENNGWDITANYPFTSVGISGELNSHKKILNLTDNSATDTVGMYDYFPEQSSGIIDFYLKSENKAKVFYFQIHDGNYLNSIFMTLFWDAGSGDSWKYFDTDYHNIFAPVSNVWYHWKIVFDCSSGFDIYIDGELKVDNANFRGTPVALDRISIASYSTHSGYSNYLDSLSYSWEDTNPYFKGEYNQHCDIESLIDFQVDIPFEYYERDILKFNISSFHFTNLYSNVSFNFYNFTSSSWYEINYSAYQVETKQELIEIDVTNFITYLFNGTGYVRFRYYTFNCSADWLSIDMLNTTVWFSQIFTYEKTLKLIGTWKYRFTLDATLGTEYIQDWIYFNVVQQSSNFEGISESRYTTRWVLTSTATSGYTTMVYEDDLTSDSWYLTGASSFTFMDYEISTKDSKVDYDYPTQNYGGSTQGRIGRKYQSGWIETKRTYFVFGNNPAITGGYLDENRTGFETDYELELEVGAEIKYYSSPNWYMDIKKSYDFVEGTICWNNKPAVSTTLVDDYDLTTSQGEKVIDLGTSTYSDVQYLVLQEDFTGGTTTDGEINDRNNYMKEYGSEWARPKLRYYFSKIYHTTSGEGYAYMQTSTTETIGLESSQYSSTKSLNSGDYFTIDLQTISDNAQLKLYNNGILQKTLNVLVGNTETGRQEVEVVLDSDVSFDQVQITSELSNIEYLKLYDIKADHWVFEQTQDQNSMYVEPYGQNELIIEYVGNTSLKIYEAGILKEEDYVNIGYNLYTHVFESQIPETVFVSFYDANNEYLDFNNFKTYVDYTLYNETYSNQRLTNREFFVDEGSYITFRVNDSFDSQVYSSTRLAKTFIDITLDVYTLKIKNEALDDASYILIKGSVSKSGLLFPDDIDIYQIATGSYEFKYIKGSDPEETVNFELTGNRLLKINRSQMCFLSFVNQRGEHLAFEQFKTYWNSTLLYENIFYEDIGINVSLEIKDLYDISIKNQSFICSSGDNYVPVVLTIYSLKVMNQQEQFNHINITRDPNYYESDYSWSEWIAPNEIIEFELFTGYYKINLTDNEGGSYSYYEYTLNADDILLISSDNVISQVIYNIANVNTTLGNQITNVEINITNQNSAINQSIINVDINLSNVNSTLGNLLTAIDLNITNIANNISTLYTFTNNSFINLNNDMNSSFIYMENNIISVNQSISNLVIGVSNDVYLINGTISSLITQVDTNILLMNTSIHTFLNLIDINITAIGNNITENYILLNNTLNLIDNNINDSRIAILNNLALVNNTISNLVSEVYSAVYLINNSIYNAVVDLGAYLTLMNNTIDGNLSIILQQNDFLTELYKMTMFSELLNWTDVGLNTTLLTSQVDAWEFINNYKNESITVFLKYQDLIENLTISAQNTIEQFLPNEDVEYRLWSVEQEEYLTEWEPLPENRTVDFGFFEAEIPLDPDKISAPFYNIIIMIFIFAVLIVVITLLYSRSQNKRKNVPKYIEKSYNFKPKPTTIRKSLIKD